MKRIWALVVAVLSSHLVAISGEVHSRAIDTSYRYWASPAIAIGPHREVAIVFARADTVFLYLSTDNGRTFAKSSFDHHWELGYNFEFETGPADVAFDHAGNLYVFWGVEHNEDLIDWQFERVAQSTDGGKTFTTQTISLKSHLISNSYVLLNSRFSFDKDDNIVLLAMQYDGYFPLPRIFYYAAYSVADSTTPHASVLAIPPNYQDIRIISDAIAYDDSVDAVIVLDTLYGAAGIPYDFVFANTRDTVQPTLFNDTTYINYAKFLSHSSHGDLLATIHNYSSLVTRTLSDSSAPSPQVLNDNLRMYDDPPSIERRDSSIYIAYYRYRYLQPDSGLCFYQMNDRTGEIRDSLILPGHRSPGIALDSLNGKYLVSIYQNKLYFTTWDVVLNVDDHRPSLASSFALAQNYPNPFNPSTSISFTIPKTSHVTLSIYNLLGQQVARLVDGEKMPGEYSVEWNAANMSSGVYFYKMTAGIFTGTKKMVVMK